MSVDISVLVYSYKGKNLVGMVENMIATATNSNLYITIRDQNPLTRKDKFKNERINYENIFWDHQYGPVSYRYKFTSNMPLKHVLMVTDDIYFNPGWDERLIEFMDDRHMVISGSGDARYYLKDKYFLGIDKKESNDFTKTQIVDHNFIFTTRAALLGITYPSQFKYWGESEMLGIEFFCNGFDIYSAPSDLYKDLGARTLENLYAPFSLEHKYNDFISVINGIGYNRYEDYEGLKRKLSDFLSFHNIQKDDLKPLPYQNDDVLYDPNTLKFVDVGGERFLATVKAIY